MIDIRKLHELVRLMVENDLSELDLKDERETVTIKRGAGPPIVSHHPVLPAAQVPQHPVAPAPSPPTNNGEADTGLIPIVSPMVGTFYSSPNPDAKPFVSVGASISPETVVCLIEAMKVFNEIKAEMTGVVERVLVQNGTAVEFGQRLYLVRPA